MEHIESFWQDFLKATNRNPSTTYVDSFHFELSEKWANILLQLVLEGKKQATASSLNAYVIEGSPLPQVGNLNIVTDWNKVPYCVIETTNVRLLPFKDMTYDIAKLEGEDDDLASWQRGHQRFYQEEGAMMGYTFTEDLIVVFEEFKVVYKKDYPNEMMEDE